jgi:hypothetical protein
MRNTSVTALQALSMLNDKTVVKLSEEFAGRIERLGLPGSDQQVKAAWRLAFGHEPHAAQLDALVAYRNQFGLPNLCRVIFNSNEFLFLN